MRKCFIFLLVLIVSCSLSSALVAFDLDAPGSLERRDSDASDVSDPSSGRASPLLAADSVLHDLEAELADVIKKKAAAEAEFRAFQEDVRERREAFDNEVRLKCQGYNFYLKNSFDKDPRELLPGHVFFDNNQSNPALGFNEPHVIIVPLNSDGSLNIKQFRAVKKSDADWNRLEDGAFDMISADEPGGLVNLMGVIDAVQAVWSHPYTQNEIKEDRLGLDQRRQAITKLEQQANNLKTKITVLEKPLASPAAPTFLPPKLDKTKAALAAQSVDAYAQQIAELVEKIGATSGGERRMKPEFLTHAEKVAVRVKDAVRLLENEGSVGVRADGDDVSYETIGREIVQLMDALQTDTSQYGDAIRAIPVTVDPRELFVGSDIEIPPLKSIPPVSPIQPNNLPTPTPITPQKNKKALMTRGVLIAGSILSLVLVIDYLYKRYEKRERDALLVRGYGKARRGAIRAWEKLRMPFVKQN